MHTGMLQEREREKLDRFTRLSRCLVVVKYLDAESKRGTHERERKTCW